MACRKYFYSGFIGVGLFFSAGSLNGVLAQTAPPILRSSYS